MSKKKPLTIDQFLKKFARKVRRDNIAFDVDGDGNLRCSNMCPITIFTGKDSEEYLSAAKKIGLPARCAEEIVHAADHVNTIGDNLRTKLLIASRTDITV